MTENLPEVGGEYVYKGQNVKVVEVRKRGRGYQVFYEGITTGGCTRARLKDWLAGAQ